MEKDLTKQLLSALYEATEPLSGQELAEGMQVSRTAIWKAMGKLRELGYQIEAAPNRGYQLIAGVDRPFPEEVKRGLATSSFGRKLLYYNQLGSTNDELRALAREGAVEGTVVIADQQLAGKGRWGRSWYSPGENLTFSLLLRPSFEPWQAGLLAPLVGVACLEVITSSPYNIPCTLKWPNDLMVSGRKLGGILIELSAELERIHYVVVGLGLNINGTFENAPSEVQRRATSIRAIGGRKWKRVPLLQELLASLEAEYQHFVTRGPRRLLDKYRSWCDTLGQEVEIYSRGELVARGIAEDLDESCNLVLATENGPVTVTSGEVSLRQN